MRQSVRLGILQTLLVLGFLVGGNFSGANPSSASVVQAAVLRAGDHVLVLAQHIPANETSDSRLSHWSDGDDDAPAMRARTVVSAAWKQRSPSPLPAAELAPRTHPVCASPPRAPPLA